MTHLRIDNFFDDFEAESKAALNADYTDYDHLGVNYKGICVVEDTVSKEKIETAIGAKFKEFICFYRNYDASMKQGTWIHCDPVIGTYSAIAFLNTKERCNGGLAFWRHRALNTDGSYTQEQEKALGVSQDLYQQIHRDGFHEERWEMIDYVAMQPNRIVIFDSMRFHSRYPDKQTDRCIKAFFGKL